LQKRNGIKKQKQKKTKKVTALITGDSTTAVAKARPFGGVAYPGSMRTQ
jgi:hypothetical protein